MIRKKPTPRRASPRGASSIALVKHDLPSIAQLEEDRKKRENFDKGCIWAAAALCGMFAVMSLGSWWFGW